MHSKLLIDILSFDDITKEGWAELEPVRPDRTRPDEKFIRLNETGFLPVFCRIFAGFLPDFCQFDVKNEPDGFYRIFVDFLPDFCQFDVKNEPAGFQPDRTGQILNPTGPDRMEKIRPVPTLRLSLPISRNF